MGHDDHYVYTGRFLGIEKIDKALENIAKEGDAMVLVDNLKSKGVLGRILAYPVAQYYNLIKGYNL